MRRTGRTLALGLKVTPAFDAKLREIADRDKMLLAEVLEWSLHAYEASKAKT